MTVSRLHCLIYSFCSTFVCHQMVLRRNMFPVPPSVGCILIITLEISYYLAGDTDYRLLVSICHAWLHFKHEDAFWKAIKTFGKEFLLQNLRKHFPQPLTPILSEDLKFRILSKYLYSPHSTKPDDICDGIT